MTHSDIALRSYAKINLGLHVLWKRPDDYHEVRTVLQTVALHDRLTIRRTRKPKIDFKSDCRGIDPADNLVVRAVQLFQKRAKIGGGFQIWLEKRIPPGSGMGGGSSNAAVTLLGLRRLFELQFSDAELLEWGAALGTDVPFFVLGGRALGLGRGSEVYPLEETPRKPVLLAIPAEGISTAGAYQRLSLQLTNRDAASKIPVFCLGFLEGLNGGKGPGNDFEQVVFEDLPWLRTIKEKWIRCGAEVAGLTGSGSALFAVFGESKGLMKAVSAAGRRDLRLIQTHTLNRLQYQKKIIESLH